MDTQRAAPLVRACTGCRSKKVRCLANKSSPGTCERCYEKGIECVIPKKQRKAPKDKLQNRVTQLEDEISKITAALASERQPSSARTVEQALTPDISSISGSKDHEMVSAAQTPATNHLPDVFDQGLITIAQAELLLQRFRHMSRFFPYVVVPPAATISDLRRRTPFLLLSILATASSQNRPLQVSFDQLFRKQLSDRFVVEGTNSLEMVQGLLIYLAWYHFHIKPVYRLTALAVSMVVDLGINRRPKESEKEKMRVSFAKPSQQDFSHSGPDFWNPEAKRAFIGCYVLCSRYSLILRKLNHMPFTPYVEECALSLAAECHIPTDAMIPYHVRLLHYGEDVNEIFGYSDSNYPQQMTEDRLMVSVKALRIQFRDIKASIPPSVAANCAFLSPLLHMAEAHTYEIGLYGPIDSPLSVFRVNFLFDCLLTAKNYFDAILASPQEDMQDWSTIEWSRLHYCITLVINLTIGIQSPSWDIASVRQTIKLESYLELICQRVTHALRSISVTGDESNTFAFFLLQWDIAKNRYQIGLRRRGLELPAAEINQGQLAHQANFDALDGPQAGFEMLTGFDYADFMSTDGFWFTSNIDPWPLGTI